MKMKKLLLEARKKEKKNWPLLYSGRKFGNPMAAFTQKIKNMLNKLADLAKDISQNTKSAKLFLLAMCKRGRYKEKGTIQLLSKLEQKYKRSFWAF